MKRLVKDGAVRNKEDRSADLCKVIFGPRIKCWSNAANTPQTFCHDQTKIRK